MKRIAKTASLLCLLAIVGLAGCQTVHVQDTEGEPIPWAAVTVVEQGGEPSLPVYTDAFGNALLPMEWDEEAAAKQKVEATKDGYRSRKATRGEGRVEIQLMKMPGR